MARPRMTQAREATIADLRGEFLDRCKAKNLSPRTLEWYEDERDASPTGAWERGILLARDLTTDDLEDFVLSLQAGPYQPQTGRGFAQIAKTISRYGHRKGLIPNDLTRDLEMTKVPKTVIQTFSDDQLEALLNQPDQRRWKGLRDRAILLTLLDTMARVSELAGVDASSVDLEGRTIRVMGKGRKERDLPLGKAATRSLQRYRNAVDGLQDDDPFFISYRGRRLDRSVITDMVADYGRAAGITRARCRLTRSDTPAPSASSSRAGTSSRCRSCLGTPHSSWCGAMWNSQAWTSLSSTSVTARRTPCCVDRPRFGNEESQGWVGLAHARSDGHRSSRNSSSHDHLGGSRTPRAGVGQRRSKIGTSSNGN